MTVLLLVGAAGLVVTLEGVTTVRVTVLDGWVVVVVGFETPVLPVVVGLVVLTSVRELPLAAGFSVLGEVTVLGAVTVVVVGLLVELPSTGRTVLLSKTCGRLSAETGGLLVDSLRGLVTVALLLPPPWPEALPVPVVPATRLS